MANNTNEDLIPIVNMRTFFNREIFMHALGDIRFKQPIALKQAAYTMFFLLIWTLPIALTFKLNNPYVWMIALVPPIALGRYANKPIWGGRTLIDFIKVTFKFLGEPKGWTETKANNELGKAVYSVEQDVWISRRRELNVLADEKEIRKKSRRRKK